MPGQDGSFSLLNYRVCQLPLKSADAGFASNAVTFYRFGPLLLIYETILKIPVTKNLQQLPPAHCSENRDGEHLRRCATNCSVCRH